MSKLSRKVELVANLLIIVIAVLLVGVIVQRYFFAKPDSAEQPRLQPTVGSQVKLSDENFANQPKTLILALQTTCHFCNESAPFYKRLLEETKGKNIKFVAVLPQTVEESTAHLKDLGLSGLGVRSSPLRLL